jgi:hypothetical protein
MDSAARARLETVVTDLRRIFGPRVEAIVAYGGIAEQWSRLLALVASLTMDDLTALAAATPSWHGRGIATPLVMPRVEFARSLDAFPVEYGDIIDTHVMLAGADPFVDVQIAPGDLRRALEGYAASHLLHLRENFMEAGARPRAVDALVRESAPGFHAILRRLARLDGVPAEPAAALAQWAVTRIGLDPRVVGDVLALDTEAAPAVDPLRLFPDYVSAVERLLQTIDQWRAS